MTHVNVVLLFSSLHNLKVSLFFVVEEIVVEEIVVEEIVVEEMVIEEIAVEEIVYRLIVYICSYKIRF